MKTDQRWELRRKEETEQALEREKRIREQEQLYYQQRQLKELSAEVEAAAAFERAAKGLLDAVNSTIAALQQGKEKTRSILDDIELRLGSSHG